MPGSNETSRVGVCRLVDIVVVGEGRRVGGRRFASLGLARGRALKVRLRGNCVGTAIGRPAGTGTGRPLGGGCDARGWKNRWCIASLCREPCREPCPSATTSLVPATFTNSTTAPPLDEASFNDEDSEASERSETALSDLRRLKGFSWCSDASELRRRRDSRRLPCGLSEAADFRVGMV